MPIELYTEYDSLQPLVIDFETFWSTAVSLRNMPIDQYVPLAEPILCTYNWLDGQPTKALVGMDECRNFFGAVDWERTLLVAHNAQFDAAVLRDWFGHIPAAFYCTMYAARPHMVPFSKSMGLGKLANWLKLPVKKGNFAGTQARDMRLRDFSPQQLQDYIDYAITDTDLCVELYRRTAAQLDINEKLMLHATIRKSIVKQLVLDRPLVEDALFNERLRKENLFKSSGIDKEDIMSNAKFAKLLTSLGVSPPMKISPTTQKQTYAFAKNDANFLLLTQHKNERVRMAVECRLNGKSTIEETRLQRFLDITTNEVSIPFPLMYYGAHTGRFSGTDKLNMQNPTKGSALRDAIMAPKGMKLVVSDLSQIEARMVAWLAMVHSMLDAFCDPEKDVYCDFGNSLGIWDHVSKDTPKERFISKMGVLSLMYGVGAARFEDAINTSGVATIEEDTAKAVVYGYRGQYPEIKALWNLLDHMLDNMIKGQSQDWGILRFVGYGECTMYGGAPFVQLPEGRRIYYPNLQKDGDGRIQYEGHRGWRPLWGGTFLENISQALAQIVIRNIELRMMRKIKFNKFSYAAGQAHDELIYCVPEQNADRFAEILTETMREGDDWNQRGSVFLPLDCETVVVKRYGEAK